MRNPLLRALFLSAIGLACSASLPLQAQNATPALVIEGGTLIDGNGGAPVPNAVVVIQGNRITAVSHKGAMPYPAGARIIQADGKFIVPGLIDAKSNYYWEYGEANLVWGVTSNMISGARNDVGIAERDAIDHGVFAGPRIYQTFISISGPGRDGKKPDNFAPGLGTRVFYTADQIKQAVDDYAAAGADFITFDDGDGAPELFAPGVAEAHRLGKAVAFRSVGPQTRAHEAAAMDADVLVHTGEVGDQIAKDLDKWKDFGGFGADAFSEMDEAKVPAMVKFLLDHHAALEPELITGAGAFSKNPARVRDEVRAMFTDVSLRAYMPDYRIQNLLQKVEPPEKTMTAEQRQSRALAFRNHAQFLHAYVQAGGHVIAATDCPQAAPGLGLLQEMALFQEDVGMTPMQVLQSATKWTADAFKIKDIGSVEAGKFADVVIVDADPLKDVNNLKKIDTVIKDGKIVDRVYHAWYRSPFGKSQPNAGNPVIPDARWAAALKQATAGGGGRGGNATAVQNPVQSPTPGLESLFPYELRQGADTTVLTIKGFNFVQRSVVYVDGIAVPTKVVSRTEIAATVDRTILAKAGRFEVTIRNPEPLATPDWGGISNVANLLVPFAFTSSAAFNKY